MDANRLKPKETVSASKKLGRKDATAMAKAASKVIVAKGKKVDTFETGATAPATVVDAMLGPTGNLRAPCIKVGKTLLVGFNDEVYEQTML